MERIAPADAEEEVAKEEEKKEEAVARELKGRKDELNGSERDATRVRRRRRTDALDESASRDAMLLSLRMVNVPLAWMEEEDGVGQHRSRPFARDEGTERCESKKVPWRCSARRSRR